MLKKYYCLKAFVKKFGFNFHEKNTRKTEPDFIDPLLKLPVLKNLSLFTSIQN